MGLGARRDERPHAHSREERGPTGDEGFTLVEVIAAVVVFVVISCATLAVLVQGLRVVRENSDRVMAATIARSQIEYLRSLGTTAIPIGLTTGAVPPGQGTTRVDARLLDPKFTIRTTANWVGFNQSASACLATDPGQAYLRVSVEVTSANLDAPAKADTVLSPTTTVAPSGLGTAAISVVDQVGAPVSDVLVRGTDAYHGANAFTLTTGSDGCLFLPGLTPTGSLALTVGRTGYVSNTPTGTSATMSITANALSRQAFKLAAAASLQFASVDETFPLPAAMPVTWQFNTTGASASVAAAGGPVTGLWPEPSGINAFAGQCSDADPLTYSLSRENFALEAGGLAVAQVATAPVKLRGITAATPVVAHYVGSDTACTVTTVALGTTNAQGVLKVGLPYGRWTFSAGGQTQTAPVMRPDDEGNPPPVEVVAFTLANLDGVCPSASPSGSASPTPTDTASPSASVSGCPSPSGSP